MLKEVEGVEVTLRGEGIHQTKCCTVSGDIFGHNRSIS